MAFLQKNFVRNRRLHKAFVVVLSNHKRHETLSM